MADYIEREAAISSLCCDCSATRDCRPGERCVDYQRIKEIPVADVRPVVRGKWIPCGDGKRTCSECGHFAFRVVCNFCPNCGCSMEVDE